MNRWIKIILAEFVINKMAGTPDWWDTMSEDEQREYLQNHPGSDLRVTQHAPSAEDMISLENRILMEKAEAKNRAEMDRRLKEISNRKMQLENDPEEILTTIESGRFKVESQGLRDLLDRILHNSDPEEDLFFQDMQPDFNPEEAALLTISTIMNQEPTGKPPEPEPSIFYNMMSMQGKSFEDIVEMSTQDISDYMTQDFEQFVEDVLASGHFKDSERVASQVEKSKTWHDWLERSRELFMTMYVSGEN